MGAVRPWRSTRPAPLESGTGPAVGVADGQGGQHSGPMGGVGPVVARRLSGGQGVKLGYPGPQGEHRAEGGGPPWWRRRGALRTPYRAMPGRAQPQGEAGVVEQAVATLEVDGFGGVSGGAQAIHRCPKAPELLPVRAWLASSSRSVSARWVNTPGHPQMGTAVRGGQALGVVPGDAQTVEAGVHLEVDGQPPAACVQRPGVFGAHHRLGQAVPGQQGGQLRPGIAKHQDRPRTPPRRRRTPSAAVATAKASAPAPAHSRAISKSPCP